MDETSPLYTEEQLKELLQSEGDRRVTMALKKQERDFAVKLETALGEASAAAGEKYTAEINALRQKTEELQRGLLEAERENRLRRNTLDAMDRLTAAHVPSSLSAFIVTEDAESTLTRADALAAAFKEAVDCETRARLPAGMPLPSAKSAGISKKRFREMTLSERQSLRSSDPEAYDLLVRGE